MSTIITSKEIQELVGEIDVVAAMEEGFIQYSNGNSVVPPVGELLFDEPKGETHLKYGYIKKEDYFCIKIASSFYDNPKLGISSSQGMMLLFNQKTGQPEAVLLDNGKLTDIRTAAAGALVAKYFAPKKIKAIGIIGTGIQAKLQLEYHVKNTSCKTVWVWGRSLEKARQLKAEYSKSIDIHIAETPQEVAQHCNVIITTTPSKAPLLYAADIQPGTHITAVGSDTAEKQELDSAILKKADLVIADSIPQSESRGEIYQAVKQNLLTPDRVIELGTAIQDTSLQRANEEQITVADLTGVAVQDIMISQAVYVNYRKNKS